MVIVWDEPKRLANIDKHGLDFADLSLESFRRALIRPAKRGRLQAIGHLSDGTVAVRLGTEGLSVISMRAANSAERRALR
ncbi:MAG: BrnT family toxin [Allorhizobium sp.]